MAVEQRKIAGAAPPAPPAPARVPWLGRAASAIGLTLIGFGLLLAVWQLVSLASRDMPGPAATFAALGAMLSNPFYDNGPNDKGIGIQLMASLSRVFTGWLVGAAIAIPLGILMGVSRTVMGIVNPVVQLLRPISPLAWFPIGLAILKSSPNAAIFVIIITSLWPTLINTMVGVASLPADYRNVARVFKFSPPQYLAKVLLPYAVPHILTGMRLSMGIAWLVIVAAEMLAGGTGIGYFIWDAYNSLQMPKVVAAILLIGVVGLLLDRGLEWIAKRVSYAS
jgi:nitrate/nitrite transport system permease protein